jgi:diguanylate cyclase (GGDEF)-like protein
MVMSVASRRDLRILIVEDVPADAELAIHQLRSAGLTFTAQRVENEPDLRTSLRDFAPTVILSDFTLPRFDGLSALKIAREMAPEIPFIFVSGTIGEARAIEALRNGAVDYVLKSNVARLVPAIERAADDAEIRAERVRQDAQITRLTRILRMLSGINGVVPRIADRGELLREVCRLAVTVGGYTAAVVMMKHWSRGVEPVASHGSDEITTDALRAALEASAPRANSIVGRVLGDATPFVCNDTVDLAATATLNEVLIKASLRSLVALPLIVDKTPLGVLVLAAKDVDVVSDEELGMLREVAGNLSFALQYLYKDTKVRFLSHFDSKTGLAKRSLFCERLATLLSEAPRRRARYGIAMIDIERLSLINDSFGRHTGDLLLQHVADRFKRRFQQNDQLAHIGGGTFAVMRDITTRDPEDLLPAMLEHGAAIFGEPFVIEGREIPVAVRSGLALYPEHGKDADTLVQNAEAALHNARVSGARQLRYNAEKHTQAVARLALEHKLRLALDRKQYELHYQPKVNIRTRRIEGVEALLRWRDPDAGLVSPAAFLPLLESTGLIVDVGEWIFRQAAEDCQHWQRLGLPQIRIAVNISPVQLLRADFVQSFLKATQSWSNAFAGLDIEITEGVLQDDAESEIKKLALLRAAGVKTAIDDFGTGYSSLSRISSLPIDTLKIDRSFIRGLPDDKGARTLVSTIISLARAFEMTVVAEGVETTEQLGVLWDLGCDQSQGFLHSIPVTRDELAQLLQVGKGNLMLPAIGRERSESHLG